jgi:hypothetical protein
MPEGQCVDIKGKAVKLDSSGAPSGPCSVGGGSSETGSLDVDAASLRVICCK